MPEMPKSLNVSLTPECARFITSRGASGRYPSASEIVGAALRLLERDEAGLLPEEWSRQPERKSGQTDDE